MTMSEIHKAPELRELLDSLDGYANIATRQRELTRNAMSPAAGVDATALILEGMPLDEVIDQVAANLVRFQAWQVVRDARPSAASRLGGDLDAIVHRHADTLLAGLDLQLQALATEARSLEDPGDSLEAVVQSGLVDEYRRLQVLAKKASQLRRLQQALLQEVAGDLLIVELPRVLELLYLADPAAAFPQYATWKAVGHLKDEHGNRKALTPPWPVGEDLRISYASPAFFLWAVRADAEQHIPTVPQLKAHIASAAETLDQARVTAGVEHRAAPLSTLNSVRAARAEAAAR